MNHGDDAPDSFFLGDDERIWNWILESQTNGVLVPSDDENGSTEHLSELILLSLPEGYFYWDGHLFNPRGGLPAGLGDISEARSTVMATANALVDDKAYIATMGLVEVTPTEFYAADLPPNRIISAKG
jgi:hypothetical protein